MAAKPRGPTNPAHQPHPPRLFPVFMGNARFTGPHTVQVDGMASPITFKKAMVATGASAAVPPIPGLRAVPHLTNNDFFNLEELPPRLVLVGCVCRFLALTLRPSFAGIASAEPRP